MQFELADEPAPAVVMRRVLDVDRVWGGMHDPDHRDAVSAIVVTQADFNRHSGRTGLYRGQFLVSLDRVETAATLPLRIGAEFQDRRRRIVVDEIIPQAQSASVRLRQFTTATMFHSRSLAELSFYLRNRDNAEAVAGAAYHPFGMSAVGLPFVFGFSGASSGPAIGFDVKSELVRFPQTYGAEGQGFDFSAEWLSRAELVIVYTVAEGSVSRAVEIPGFEIAPAPPKVRQ
jgi:hypothetical protein